MENPLRRIAPIQTLLISLLVLALASTGFASPPETKQLAQATTAAARDLPREPLAPKPSRAEPNATEAQVVYVPPRRGAPRAKVGGGLRGALALPTPLVLVPGHVAETVSAQPSLFWHIDAVPSQGARLVFTLNEESGIDPVIEADLAAPAAPGIQRIELSRLGVELAPGVEYEWSIALVSDTNHRSEDRISSASIRRVSVPSDLSRAEPTARSYAAHGLWYDALAESIDAVGARPTDTALREQRDSLLRQADLEAAVD